MRTRTYSTRFTILALGIPLAFVAFAGCGGFTNLMALIP